MFKLFTARNSQLLTLFRWLNPPLEAVKVKEVWHLRSAVPAACSTGKHLPFGGKGAATAGGLFAIALQEFCVWLLSSPILLQDMV